MGIFIQLGNTQREHMVGAHSLVVSVLTHFIVECISRFRRRVVHCVRVSLCACVFAYVFVIRAHVCGAVRFRFSWWLFVSIIL